MTARVAFDVAGLPVVKGNLRSSPSGHAYYPNARALDTWTAAIATEARMAMHEAQLLAGPLSLRVTFRLPRPKGHTGRRGLLPSAPVFPTSRPDLDKLTRAALDALTAVAFSDDSQVVHLVAEKAYGQPGASIEVSERQ